MANDPSASPSPADDMGPSGARSWILWVGAAGLILAGLFFMAIVVAGIFGYPIPCNTKPYAHVVMAIFLATASGFLGGWAKAEGKIPSLGRLFSSGTTPPASGNDNDGSPITFGIGGGGAMFVIVILLATWIDPCQGETKYKVALSKPPQVTIPPAPANKDWLVTVDFRVEPVPPSNFSLILEFSERPDFKELIGLGMLIKSPDTGQAIDQIPAPAGKQAWARLVLRDLADRQIAFSNISHVKE